MISSAAPMAGESHAIIRLNVKLLPNRRYTIQFLYRELPPPRQSWWLVVDGGAVDECISIPATNWIFSLKARSGQ
jgi:hypothetical protein